MLQTLVPPQDEAIVSALAEVEIKLSAWAQAMSEAHRGLAERSARGPGDLAATQTGVDIPPEQVEEPDITAEPSLAAALTPTEPLPAPPPAPAPARPARSMPTGTRGIVSYVTEPLTAPETVESAARDRGNEEDEALLATLDEKTAQELRMMRRLSPVKRSMRELLAEYHAERGKKPEEVPASTRTSWWKRK